VSGHEVCVQVSQEDMLDLQLLFGRKFQISSNIPLWINDGSYTRLLVTDQV
jgi:hypothetical protein